ncbi:hypothetical protein NKH14_11060 [Mesorhizobium sp. M1380]|uniref:hypothetical protein n=1 Tax=Mesorhizobium sp. M1380 TaxID=2957093 RepID=UPI003337EA10
MQLFALLVRNTEKLTDADFAPLLPGEAEQRRTLYAEGAVGRCGIGATFPAAA